jgi:hypothetical protein
MVEYLTSLGAGIAHFFERSPRDGIEHGFQRGAEGGNGEGKKDGNDKSCHGKVKIRGLSLLESAS